MTFRVSRKRNLRGPNPAASRRVERGISVAVPVICVLSGPLLFPHPSVVMLPSSFFCSSSLFVFPLSFFFVLLSSSFCLCRLPARTLATQARCRSIRCASSLISCVFHFVSRILKFFLFVVPSFRFLLLSCRCFLPFCFLPSSIYFPLSSYFSLLLLVFVSRRCLLSSIFFPTPSFFLLLSTFFFSSFRLFSFFRRSPFKAEGWQLVAGAREARGICHLGPNRHVPG